MVHVNDWATTLSHSKKMKKNHKIDYWTIKKNVKRTSKISVPNLLIYLNGQKTLKVKNSLYRKYGRKMAIFSHLDNNWAIWVRKKVPLLSIFERPKNFLAFKHFDPLSFLWKLGFHLFMTIYDFGLTYRAPDGRYLIPKNQGSLYPI